MGQARRVATLTGCLVAALVLLVGVSRLSAHICLPPGCAHVLEGRMTGGGSVFTDQNDLWVPAGTRLTHGFELNCNAARSPNNLQVNVHLPNGDGGRFHLDELQFAWCWDDPAISPNPPDAPFDTYFGRGVGRFNGQRGFCADWEFTDAGEPGTADRIRSMRIWRAPAGGTCDAAEAFLFSIFVEPGHLLTFGNHQAHAAR